MRAFNSSIQTGKALSILCHPLVLATIIITALNDHIFKGSGWFPGWFTGKLSDVTGLFFFPILLALLFLLATRLVAVLIPNSLFDDFARHWRLHLDLAATATILVFAAVNVLEPANALALRFWGVITMDPTDLLCLPMVILAHRFAVEQWTAQVEPLQPARTVKTSPIRWQHGLALVLAVVVSVATSPPRTFTVDDFPHWEIDKNFAFCFDDVEIRPWVATSGTTGAGLVLRVDNLRADPIDVAIESAQFNIWINRHHPDNRTLAIDGASGDSITVTEHHSFYLPFEFDNHRAWREEMKTGRFIIILNVDGERQRLHLGASHRSTDSSDTYYMYWARPDDSDPYGYDPDTYWGPDGEDERLERSGHHVDRKNEYLRRDPDDPGSTRVRRHISWHGGCSAEVVDD